MEVIATKNPDKMKEELKEFKCFIKGKVR